MRLKFKWNSAYTYVVICKNAYNNKKVIAMLHTNQYNDVNIAVTYDNILFKKYQSYCLNNIQINFGGY